MQLLCGLLGPDRVGSSRRLRSLGIAGAVRRFNERAVPGLGGVWFGKQLMLALLGVRIAEVQAERGRAVAKMECANAIEALACWLAYRDTGWASDPRLRGRNKFPRENDLEEGPLYARFRARGFYVTQPMRMAAGSALVPLGFAASPNRRFNSLQTTAEGRAFLTAALAGYRPSNRSMAEHLLQWVRGEAVTMMTGTVAGGLSPCLPLPGEALEHLKGRLLAGGADETGQAKARRRAALAWVERLRHVPPGRPLTWRDRPPEVQDDSHWEDLQAGARLWLARDAALQLLDALEARIAHAPAERMKIADAAPVVREQVEALRTAADAFLRMRHEDAEANEFCRACAAADPTAVLRSLAERDGRVVALVGQVLRPGAAFRRGPAPPAAREQDAEDPIGEAADETGPQLVGEIGWPEGLSFRMRNLYLLNLELHGELHVRFAAEEGAP
jgi:hypothetical protein